MIQILRVAINEDSVPLSPTFHADTQYNTLAVIKYRTSHKIYL